MLQSLTQKANTHDLSVAKAVRSKLIYKAQSVLVTAKLSGSRLDLMSANANNHDLPTHKTTYGLSGAKAVRSKLIYKAQRVLVTAKLSGSRLDLMSQNTNTHGLT